MANAVAGDPLSTPPPPPPLPPLTSVRVALRSSARASGVPLAALPHVLTVISDFLDHGLPQFWSLSRAWEANLLSLLPRLAARAELKTDIGPYCWKYQCSQGLVYAVKHDNLEMVERLHEYCPHVLPYNAMIAAAKNGNAVKWIHEHLSGFYLYLIETVRGTITSGGNTEVARFLFDNPNRYWFDLPSGFCYAVENGDLELAQWLCSESNTPLDFHVYFKPIDYAARDAHLPVVQWFHHHFPDECTQTAMDGAALREHLQVLQWLHAGRTEGSTHDAMNRATLNGHLETVKWLYENRTDGCTRDAMERAARHGHFEVLLFLRANRSEGCGPDTLRYGFQCLDHLETLQWLWEKYLGSVDLDSMRSHDSYMAAVLDHVLQVPATVNGVLRE